jgi:hypothetical protein
MAAMSSQMHWDTAKRVGKDFGVLAATVVVSFFVVAASGPVLAAAGVAATTTAESLNVASVVFLADGTVFYGTVGLVSSLRPDVPYRERRMILKTIGGDEACTFLSIDQLAKDVGRVLKTF